MANRKLDLLNFISFWQVLFGNPAKNFTMMFHGEPHNGKTIFLLMLAQYLAENFGEVLYVSSEEFASPTMTKKVNEFLNPIPQRLHFAENLTDPDLSQYQFIILDSVNDLGLKLNAYKQIRKENPNTAFIFILQHTKAGDFRGGKEWEHTAEIVGEVSKGVVNITKNRYAPKSTLDFFKQLGIQWQEPINEPSLKPYPISNDLMTSDNAHY
jgi:predicted ATP-dependent serine protease